MEVGFYWKKTAVLNDGRIKSDDWKINYCRTCSLRSLNKQLLVKKKLLCNTLIGTVVDRLVSSLSNQLCGMCFQLNTNCIQVPFCGQFGPYLEGKCYLWKQKWSLFSDHQILARYSSGSVLDQADAGLLGHYQYYNSHDWQQYLLNYQSWVILEVVMSESKLYSLE